jgi:multidrug efflux system membrane fusion protein
VGVAQAEAQDIAIVLEALGTVTPAATVTVRPQVSGVLKQVVFHEGQMVRAGQLLAEIDPRPFELALQQAIGQRQRDEAQLENARLTLQRYQTLLGQDSIARQDVDTQAALVKQLEATVVIDRANEGTARLNLGYTRVVAPIAGRLGLRVVDIGNVVSSSDAAGLAVITQQAPIDVEFALPQDRVPELQERLAARATLPATALDRTRSNVLAQGRFLALDNVVDVQTGTVRAKARFANDKNTLFPSQFVNLRLNVRSIDKAVVVPVSALRHGSDGDFVWVLNPAERTVQQRKVTRGQATVDKVQITQGLQLGESVITEGGDRLKDGARVTLPGDRPAGAASGASAGRRGLRGERGEFGAWAASGAASGASGVWGERRHRRDAAASAPAN